MSDYVRRYQWAHNPELTGERMNEVNEASPVERVVTWLRERKRKKQYVYGRVFRPEDGHCRENVRLNKQTTRVEFVLWKAGEQGHAADYWHEMGCGWEDYFQPYDLGVTE